MSRRLAERCSEREGGENIEDAVATIPGMRGKEGGPGKSLGSQI